MGIILIFIGAFLFIVGAMTQFQDVAHQDEILSKTELVQVRELLKEWDGK